MKAALPLPSPRYHALVQLLRTADTLWNASRAFFARWDLSPSEFNVLNLLEGRNDGLSQTELGRELVMHRSNITGLVDRLEKRGLVQRRNVATDRRAYGVVVTPEGSRLLGTILPHYYEEAERVGEHLPLGHAVGLIKDLRRMAKNAQKAAARMPSRIPTPP